MGTEPQTATAIAMLSSEEHRLEIRDRHVALAVAAKVVREHFKPEEIEDMRDARDQIIRAAEFAAYEAIQKERELHAGDMMMLKAFADVKWAELMLKPPSASVDTLPKGQDRNGLDAKQG